MSKPHTSSVTMSTRDRRPRVLPASRPSDASRHTKAVATIDPLTAAFSNPDYIAKTALIGIVPTARGPTDFAAFIKGEVETNTELLKEAGYKPD